MVRKSIAIFTLGAFMLLTWSCVPTESTKMVPSSKVNWGNTGGPILAVQKRSGERVEFAREGPGWYNQGSVVGHIWVHREFDKSQVESTKTDERGQIIGVITNDGKPFGLKYAKVDDEKISGLYFDSVSIPVSDLDLVWVQGKAGQGKYVIAGLMIAVVMAGMVAAQIDSANTAKVPEAGEGTSSCPFIYSFDGKDFQLDGEPYGGSICRALQRTEWSGLDHLQEVNGQYRLFLTNELEETEHTDELKLVVVDHPRGTEVIPDANGRIHTLSRPLSPHQAYDREGRDILPLVSKKDQVFWLTRTENKDPNRDSDLRDELIFEFPKPTGAKQVKLVANAWTTQWGTSMGKRFLEFYGRELPGFLSSVNSYGRAFPKIMRWFTSEELYTLQVRVETETGWKAKGMIYGSGAYIAKDKAYILDIADVPGDTLKIKLTPAATFWKLDSLAVDYTPDLPLNPVELSPIKAVDKTGRDVSEALAHQDGRCYDMPNEGDSAEITFLAPPLSPGLARSVILKASGYYDVQINATGDPRAELIRRVEDEPGFGVRYALREFQRIQKAAQEKLTSR